MKHLEKTISCFLLLSWLVPVHSQKAVDISKETSTINTTTMRTKPLHPIEKREASADDSLVDLGPYYNFALSEEIHGKPDNTIPIPAGISEYAGVKIDTRGVIQLASNVSLQNSHIEYPEKITGIAVNHMASSLCFLHSSAWASKKGTDVWKNPLPEIEITSIDLISSMNDTGYMLFGISCL